MQSPALMWRIAAVSWMALIFILSAWPGASSEGTHTFFGDWNAIARTAAHVGVFGILAGLCKQALTPAGGRCSWKRWSLALLVAGVFGASDEFHQLFVPGRFGRWQDVACDFVGAVIALIVLRLYEIASSRLVRGS